MNPFYSVGWIPSMLDRNVGKILANEIEGAMGFSESIGDEQAAADV
jgi:hypothetical protein